MRVQNDLGPIMPATSSQCYAVCSTSCGMYYNLCWELLAKWAINQLQLCLLVQCTFDIQYQMQQINISYFLFSFSYTLIHSWWTIFLRAWPLFIIKLFHRCYNLDTIESLSAQKRKQAGQSFDVYSSGSFSNYQNILLFCMQTPIGNECHKSLVNFSLMKDFKKYLIFSPAFYPIMCLMKLPKNLEKIVILKI